VRPSGGAMVSGGASATACAADRPTGRAPPGCARRADQYAAVAAARDSMIEKLITMLLLSIDKNSPQPTSAHIAAVREVPSTRPESSRRPSLSSSCWNGTSSQQQP
jgi:hypothetical protein